MNFFLAKHGQKKESESQPLAGVETGNQKAKVEDDGNIHKNKIKENKNKNKNGAFY